MASPHDGNEGIMKILVVDDSKTNRLLIKNILEGYGHDVCLACNGIEALVLIAQIMPDVILLDILMPEMDGYETCRFITNNPDTKDIPIIILTALDKVNDLVKAFDAGAMDFIRKPPDELELIARINSAIRIKQYQDRLKEMIIKDGLTGIYTHSYFISVLEREFHSVRRYDGELGLILFDIDDFKRVNDTHGHIAGDKILIMVSKLLLENIRKTDIPSRYGGEEFGLIVPHSSVKDTCDIAERLRKGIEQSSIEERHFTISVTISVGVTFVESKDRHYNDIIRRADDALYEAKRTGKNRIVTRKC